MKKNIVFDQFISIRSKPSNLIDEDENLFSHELLRKFDKIYYFHVRNATVVNQSVYKIKNFRIFSKYHYFYRPPSIKIIKDIVNNLIKSKNSSTVIDKGIWITDNKSSVYFHWLCDAMGRWTILPSKFDDYPVLLPEKYEINWIIEILNFLDVKYIIFKANEKIKVKNLILTSYPAPSGNFHKKTLLKLKNKFLLNYTSNDEIDLNFKNVWIDMDSHRRPVKNIEKIRPVLDKYKFKEVKMEELNINEKITLLQNTHVLLGSHSSGLTNMLFMKPGSIVIDIRDPEDSIKNAFFSMASELDLKYYYMEREKDKDGVIIEPYKLENLLAALF